MWGTDTASREGNECDWLRAHEALSRLARERAAADAEEGRSLLAARRSAAHVHLGFGSFGEYVERLFGYTRRTVQEKLRVAEALEELPQLARALDTGELGWSAARELTRVAVAGNEQEWLDLARGRTLRQLEELVAGKHLGDDPAAAGRPEATRRVLRFEVAAETFAAFREALTALRRGDDAWDDDSALLSMARQVLGGPRDDGRASYQIVLAVCPSCGAGRQQASGELVPVAAEVVAMAQCDGQHLGCIPSRAANENARGNTASPTSDTDRTDARDPIGAHVDADLRAETDSVRAHTGARGNTSLEDHHANVDVNTDIPTENVPTSDHASVRADHPIENVPPRAPALVCGDSPSENVPIAPVLTRAKQPFRPRYAGPCCCAISSVVECRVAEKRRSSTYTISSCAPKAGETSWPIS